MGPIGKGRKAGCSSLDFRIDYLKILWSAQQGQCCSRYNSRAVFTASGTMPNKSKQVFSPSLNPPHPWDPVWVREKPDSFLNIWRVVNWLGMNIASRNIVSSAIRLEFHWLWWATRMLGCCTWLLTNTSLRAIELQVKAIWLCCTFNPITKQCFPHKCVNMLWRSTPEWHCNRDSFTQNEWRLMKLGMTTGGMA